MPAILGTNLKRVRAFIDKNGTVKEGGIEENMGGHVMGRVTVSDRLPGEAENKQAQN